MQQPACFKKYHLGKDASAIVVEFVGTFLFILTIPLSVSGSGDVAPLAIGFMLMAMIFCFGYISGGHFNPAVTLAVMLARPKGEDMKLKTRAFYIVAQLAGGFAAAFYCFIILGPSFPVPDTANDMIKVGKAFFAESVYTFVLASVVLHVACSSQKDNNFYGFAIGMAVLSAALCVGGVSGGAFNPAVATGLIVFRCLTGYCVPMYHLWVYWVAECLGALVAAILYNLVTDAFEAERALKAAESTGSAAIKSKPAAAEASLSREMSSRPATVAPTSAGAGEVNPLETD